MDDLAIIACFKADGLSAPDTEYFQFNVGEIIELVAHAVVTDRSGKVICDQALSDTKSVIKTDSVPVASIFLSNSKGTSSYEVELSSNPIRFIIAEPCYVEITTTGYGCRQYIAEPVVAIARLQVLAPRLMSFDSAIAENPIIDRNVLEFSKDGSVGADNMTFTIKNSSNTEACFGILHCYSAYSVATDVQGKRRDIENHRSRAVRSFSDNDFIWNKINIESLDVFTIGDGYKPSVYICNEWLDKFSQERIGINRYDLAYEVESYVMFKSYRRESVFVPIACFTWQVTGAAFKSGANWSIDEDATHVEQLRHVTFDLPNYTGNPTSCKKAVVISQPIEPRIIRYYEDVRQ